MITSSSPVHAGGENAAGVPLGASLQRVGGEDIGIGLGLFLQHVERVERLKIDRLLGPERAIIVEGGDAVLGGDVVVRGWIGHRLDKFDDRRLGAGVVPRRQRIGEGGGVAWARTARTEATSVGELGILRSIDEREYFGG